MSGILPSSTGTEHDAANAQEPLEESIEILTNLMESIRKHGNYSPESTVTFIDGALQCLREVMKNLHGARNTFTAGVAQGDAWSASKHDEIIKRLMAGVGMPNSTSLYTAFKQFANELHALAHAAQQPASNATSEISQHIGWLKQYVHGMTADNWQDMRLRAERQLDELSRDVRGVAYSSPDRDTIARIINGVAFRPAYISGEGLSETDKEKYLRARNVAYYKADCILAEMDKASSLPSTDREGSK